MRRDRLRKPQQRREALLDAVVVMFAEMLYDDVMVQEIAAKRGGV